MNILFLTPVVPCPPVDGDRQRAFHLLRALARRHRVQVCAFYRSPEERAQLETLKSFCAGVTGVRITSSQIRWNSVRAWWGSRPLNVAAFDSPAMRRAIAELVRSQRFDAVHAYRLRMAPYALGVPVPTRILDYTDALTRYFQARLEQSAPFWKRFYLKREARHLAIYEAGVARQFNTCLISSPLDRDFLYALGATHSLRVVTNGVDTRVLRPAPRGAREKTVLFVGNMQYPPNAEGIAAFCRDTWPRVLREEPSARLAVAGLPPKGERAQWEAHYPGAEFLGLVPDLKSCYARARVVVCPLAVASGRQFKVIEAFAAGVPVVTTRVVAKNLDAAPGKEILTADAPEAMALGILRLLRDAKLARSLSARARALAVKAYDWSRVTQDLLRVYTRVKG